MLILLIGIGNMEGETALRLEKLISVKSKEIVLLLFRISSGTISILM